MRHLQTGPLEAALDVEALIGFAAVEDGLVAADLLCDEVEGLDQTKTQLLPLLVLCDGNVLDVADFTEVVDASKANCVLARVNYTISGTARSSRSLQWHDATQGTPFLFGGECHTIFSLQSARPYQRPSRRPR